jgi:cytochrome P450
MRNLIDIVEEVKDGGKPDYEELRYALLAYNSMLFFDHKNLIEELLKEPRSQKFIRELKAKNSDNMYRNALNKSPKEYIGNYDPDNPDYQRQRQVHQKIFDKFMKDCKYIGDVQHGK